MRPAERLSLGTIGPLTVLLEVIIHTKISTLSGQTNPLESLAYCGSTNAKVVCVLLAKLWQYVYVI